MDVPSAEHDFVVVDEPDVLIHHVVEVTQAVASLVDEETDGLRGIAQGDAASKIPA